MARRLGRNFDNPERRIDSVESSVNDTTMHPIESNYEDDFDKRLDMLEDKDNDTSEKNDFWNRIKRQVNNTERPQNTQRNTFLQEIRVEQEQDETPLTIAYRELDIARRSGVRKDIINAEDRILDIERQEEERQYNIRISELKEMQKKARESGDSEALTHFKKERQKFISEMKYDELNYKLRKLQNSQRLEPNNEKLKQIVALKQELDALELESMNR